MASYTRSATQKPPLIHDRGILSGSVGSCDAVVEATVCASRHRRNPQVGREIHDSDAVSACRSGMLHLVSLLCA
ncbi:hypothetical protein NSPZN2_100006 [Nitrospira defluvii]|uniref:Uncharacterized protein n=1 Tax=Nitrospira defluvii TaxID=330214 RepID=A0ABM8QYZ3_9BACT|nr:hypothetical protein NSPZN2_100006 [Nitrospira defluvii]